MKPSGIDLFTAWASVRFARFNAWSETRGYVDHFVTAIIVTIAIMHAVILFIFY